MALSTQIPTSEEECQREEDEREKADNNDEEMDTIELTTLSSSHFTIGDEETDEEYDYENQKLNSSDFI